jgi:hypothetical protein
MIVQIWRSEATVEYISGCSLVHTTGLHCVYLARFVETGK